MIQIIISNIKYIVTMIMSLLGIFLLKKNSSLKQENEKINNDNDKLKNQIVILNEIEKTSKNIKPANYSDNSKRMHKNLL